jgi:MoaD family protein
VTVANVTMKLPVGLTYPDGQKEAECQGATVGEALASVVQTEPRLKSRIFREDGGVWVGIFINGRNIRQLQGMDTPLTDGDKLMLVPPISGG